tara:strand:- start:77 stop:439 length:363 start_codon:yes stop_codon:yes gene_type:complete
MPNITVSNEIFAELEKLGDEFTSSPDPDIFILDTPEKVIGHLLFMALRNEENKMPKQNENMTVGDLVKKLEKYDDDTLVLASRNIDENEVEWLEITGVFDASDEDSKMLLLYIDPTVSIS